MVQSFRTSTPMKGTHVLHDDRVILDETTRSAEDDNTTVGGVRYDIVSDDAVGTTETDAVGPLLERVRAARADVVVLDYDAGAVEWTFCNVETRPGAGVE